MAVELLLGGRIGLWALEQVDVASVSRVVTRNPEIAATAAGRSVPVEREDVNASPPTESPIGFSIHYPKVLSEATLGRYSIVYNLHPSMLPWGRGAYAAFWSIWAGEPAGASVDVMIPRVDAGPVVDQERVDVRPSDTCGLLHARITEAERLLFRRHWLRLMAGELPNGTAQASGGSYHSIADYDSLVGQGSMMGGMDELLRLIRAVTFGPESGLAIDLGGARFRLRLDRTER